MSHGNPHSDLAKAALQNARRLEASLRRDGNELDRAAPAETEGREAMRKAVRAAEALTRSMAGSLPESPATGADAAGNAGEAP